jgi:glycosyltransferase involved in cell wall biosynthesis
MSGALASDIFNGLSEISGNNVKLLVKPYDRFVNKNILSIQNDWDYFLFRLKSRIRNEYFKIFGPLKKENRNSNDDYYFFDFDETLDYYPTNKFIKRAGFKPDVILVLFMTSFVTYRNLYELNKRTNAGIFILMMDMAPITGGCHYAWSCRGYEKSCGKCPALYSLSGVDQSHRNWAHKKKLISQTNITLIAATSWQFRQAKNSSLFIDKECKFYLSPTNENSFFSGNEIEARLSLALPLDKKIILFGAVYVQERRKGHAELIQILNILKGYRLNYEIHLVVVGNASEELERHLPFEATFLGYLDRKGLATAYQAASVFLCTSIEDSGPTMINQSLMCGTPVVAFEMGVAPDLVFDDTTGYIAKLGDCNEFALGVDKILNFHGDSTLRIRNNCRKVALEKSSLKTVLGAYQKMFTESVN